ncbi:hypothetical protein TPR58_13820 [Sphingomonas sp. HF-S3]|jgi:hypothetical protein|uniref:Uncharacterized protein n=1 Tax=Sphingomonas rustica TaxID=3103142 RepID=A0ABV0B9K1_9SPHN
MDPRDPLVLAAELRACAEIASDEDRADLLFLADEYERLAELSDDEDMGGPLNVSLPK